MGRCVPVHQSWWVNLENVSWSLHLCRANTEGITEVDVCVSESAVLSEALAPQIVQVESPPPQITATLPLRYIYNMGQFYGSYSHRVLFHIDRWSTFNNKTNSHSFYFLSFKRFYWNLLGKRHKEMLEKQLCLSDTSIYIISPSEMAGSNSGLDEQYVGEGGRGNLNVNDQYVLFKLINSSETLSK